MRSRPVDCDDDVVAAAVRREWAYDVAAVEWVPAGFGSQHWRASGRDGAQWFVTVDDLDDKPWLGADRVTTYAGLGRAFDTARRLYDDCGLSFVVAPLPTVAGASLSRIDDRFAVSVFPHVEAPPAEFGEYDDSVSRGAVLDLLVELHTRGAAVADTTPVAAVQLTTRRNIADALADLDEVWDAGPFCARAQAVVREHADDLTAVLAAYDGLVDEVTARAAALAVTHGEPHAGNILHAADGVRLIDWDTVGLALPERDLWHIGATDALAAYTAGTGHRIDPDAIAMYALRWELEDIGSFLGDLRAPHVADADTELMSLAIVRYAEELASWRSRLTMRR